MTPTLATSDEDQLLHLPPPGRAALAHIPGSYGLPWIGQTGAWISDALALAARYQARYGPVAKVTLLGNDVVLATGEDNMQALYLNSSEGFIARLPPASPLAPFYAGALLFTDGTDHRAKRRFMQHAFKSAAMRDYVSRIDQIAAKHVLRLPTESEMPVFPLVKRFLSEVAANIFFGLEEDDPMATTLMRDFVILNQGMLALIKTRLPIPGLKFPAAIRASDRIEAYIQSVIAQKRAGDGGDVLSHLCRATDEAGAWIPDEEIVRQAKFLFFAAHDTTASSITNMMMFTGMHSYWQEAMREELARELGSAAIAYDDLERLDTVQNVLFETLRHYPPVAASPRTANAGCTLSGLEIPAGTPVILLSHVGHMHPDSWRDPQRFDPGRFGPGREEHKGHPFRFAPFGGGAHKCIGMHFAMMVTKIYFSHLLPRYSYTLPADYPVRMSMLPLPKPADDLPMRFARR